MSAVCIAVKYFYTHAFINYMTQWLQSLLLKNVDSRLLESQKSSERISG